MSNNAMIKLSEDKSIPARVTIGDIRNARSKYGIDLGDNDACLRFQMDVVDFTDAFWGIYQRHLKDAGVVTKDQLDDMFSEEGIFEDARDKVVKAISGFFLLLKTVSTKVAEAQNMNLQKVAEGAENQ